jgi:hypothetical protein
MIIQTPFLNAFAALGNALENIPAHLLLDAKHRNPWFDEENVSKAAHAWASELKEHNLNQWLANYMFTEKPKRVAIIMAGNIPFVGLHDLLCIIASGNIALCKLSSDDTVLMKYCIEILNSELPSKIEYIERVKDADAVIATGSNNSAKIFETYFSHLPNIIRRNRTAVAVLTGHETSEDLTLLGSDIFAYYGLGCRNVSKLFVPAGYDFTNFFESIFGYGNIVNHHKYANNYDYNKAIYLMGQEKFLDNHFLMLREDNISLHSPLSVLFYSYYESIEAIRKTLHELDNEIQCVVSKINLNLERQVGFGKTQQPKLWDYADGIDTMKFLNQLSL